jgi:hypothetical protein
MFHPYEKAAISRKPPGTRRAIFFHPVRVHDYITGGKKSLIK